MDIALTLPAPDWMVDADTQSVMRVLNDGERRALFVGGCVRNMVLCVPVSDIDIATSLKPQRVMELLSAENIKVIPTGIDHGTVTALKGERSFEITTLRHDVQTDGRHADVEFTQDWVEDARRRDFTMNTLLADEGGNIYDPLGCGVDDAKAGRVVFVGEPSKRITEDYLRILRFFRFYGQYGQQGQGVMDEAGLAACIQHAPQIQTLSRERVTQELSKILGSTNVVCVTKIMFENSILPDVFDNNFDVDVLARLVVFQHQYEAVMMEARLHVVAGCKPQHYHEELRLSNAQQKFLIKIMITQNAHFYGDVQELKRAIIRHGRDLVLQGYLLWQARQDEGVDKNFVKVIKSWDIPKFNLTGQDLMAEGYQTGPELGEELERRREEWIAEVISSAS